MKSALLRTYPFIVVLSTLKKIIAKKVRVY